MISRSIHLAISCGLARYVTDDERRAYATALVDACRTRGLQGIAMTDHHDMLFAEYVRRAAADETDHSGKPLPKERRLVVFPGMELTLGVPCQALILFDADFPADLFSLAMTALTITPNSPDKSHTGQVQRLGHINSLRQLKEELDKHSYLRDRYIVFPNVGNDGKWSLLRSGFPAKYIEMPCVGGYVDGSVTKLSAGNKNILAGADKNWGNKRVACIQTSDNRRDDHSELGAHTSWIKWATPTAEALRQACLAQESRVSQVQPLLPLAIIEAISVSNSVFLGPIDLELNAQYNALIGGRGTGKSTILEYLRWALCDQPPGIEDEEAPNYQARRARLIEQTLKAVNASVDVRFRVNDVPHLVRRSSADGSLLIKIASEQLRTCTEDEVRALLPIQAYSQKQLSDVSVRVEELSRFITSPIRNALEKIDRSVDEAAGRIRELFATRLRYRNLTQTLQRRELEEISLREQAAAVRASLTDLSDADQVALDNGKLYETADRTVQIWRNEIASFRSSAIRLRQTAESSLANPKSVPTQPEGELLQVAYAQYSKVLLDAKAALDVLIKSAGAIDFPPDTLGEDSPWRRWAEKFTAAKAAYDAAVQRSSVHSEKLKQLKDIEEHLAEHARETDRVREELRTLSDTEGSYRSERDVWQDLLKQRADLLDEECVKLTERSGGAIRARVRRFANASGFASILRQSLSGSRVSGAKIESLAGSIASATDPAAQWNALLLDLEKLAEHDVERDGTDRPPSVTALVAAGITTGEVTRIATALAAEDWLALSLTAIESVPIFEYRAREGEYIPFGNASAGQQATALLKTLLNEAGPPLIVDQPEEDLDNPVMLEIVEQVWMAKQKRQLIFSSHNANLVVNGDAELVAWCEYRTAGDQSRGTIAGEGAIDMPDVREAIKRIMEGGEAAFNLRKEKYGF